MKNDCAMRMMIIVLAMLGVGLCTSCKSKKKKAPLPTPPVVVAPKPEPQPEPEPVMEEPEVKQMNYYLVAGCFRVYDNAVRLNAKLLDQGYDSRIIPFYSLNMVTYDGYETRREAQVALNRIVKEPGKKKTWVYPVK